MTTQDKIRNIAIIAHVDHGKTTLVDQLFRQSGMFRANQQVEERVMDSNDLEKERGITITSKNGSFTYKDHLVNIIDTPGHADFGGQVERVLFMADGALLLVDAAEGPMPQTYFVLKKALALRLPIIIVINKIDKPAARIDWVLDQVLNLFIKLDAPDELLDFPVVYASAKEGYALDNPGDTPNNMEPLFNKIISDVPAPTGDANAPVQLLVSSLSYSTFLGRQAIGKLTQGRLKVNQPVVAVRKDANNKSFRITKIYRFTAAQDFTEIPEACTGEIIAVSGLEEIMVGDTVTDPANPQPIEGVPLDPPTLSMNFIPNDSPFSGKEGDFVTSNHLKDRLMKEILSDVALKVEELTTDIGFKVSGRGELHLSILIEKMRREGYEFQVTPPQVITKEIDGQRCEPYEEVTIDVDENLMGKVIESLGERKGQMVDMQQDNGMAKIIYKIPTRGLLGYRAQFLTETKGMGVMNNIFDSYGPYVGAMKQRKNGAIIAKENCTTIAFALSNIQERGILFMGAGNDVYGGQIIGENARNDDMIVNPGKGKKLTNVRASGSDDATVLTPHKVMSLEDCMAFINDDELIEVTPESIRLRKKYLDENERKRMSK